MIKFYKHAYKIMFRILEALHLQMSDGKLQTYELSGSLGLADNTEYSFFFIIIS